MLSTKFIKNRHRDVRFIASTLCQESNCARWIPDGMDCMLKQREYIVEKYFASAIRSRYRGIRYRSYPCQMGGLASWFAGVYVGQTSECRVILSGRLSGGWFGTAPAHRPVAIWVDVVSAGKRQTRKHPAAGRLLQRVAAVDRGLSLSQKSWRSVPYRLIRCASRSKPTKHVHRKG